MADELDRVRISEAELRAEASKFNSNSENVKEFNEEVKKHRQRECKRPDLQLYKPVSGQSQRTKDGIQGDAHSPCLDTPGCCSSDIDIKKPDSSPTITECSVITRSDTGNMSSESQLETINTKVCVSSKNHQLVEGNATKSTAMSRSPKQARKMRKPDREIYQPGGRRSQSTKETWTVKEIEVVTKEERRRGEAVGKKSLEKDDNKNIHLEKEDRRRNRRGKDGKMQDQEKQRKESFDSPPANKNEADVENIVGKVSNLSISSQAKVKASKEEGGQDGGNRRGKSSGEGRRGKAGDGVVAEDQKKEKGNGKFKAGKEKVNSNQSFTKKDEEERRSSGTTQPDQEYPKRAEVRPQKNVGGKEGNRDQNVNHDKRRGNRPKDNRGERGKSLSEGSDSNRVNSSKRYSQSDIRRPRNRTYSTSSASSGTSMDGHVEAERLRREGEQQTTRTVEFVRGNQPRPRRRTARTLSSTDSLEENEVREREDRRENRGQRTGPSGRGGILRVSLDKTPSKSSSEQQASRKNPNPRGRGRGILVLPAYTNLTMTTEPGPQLSGMRGGMSLGRGRGGRGGGTRRLWDPNNPDKKPALMPSQQSQHASLQHALYLQQGGCGPLHFLDTDDETAGSPPIRQGEYFQNQQAAAMAYYKFQNSDNPYTYPLSPNTPPRYPYPYHMPYQIPAANGMYPVSAIPPFYGPYGQGYSPTGGSSLTPEEAEVQTRGEIGKLLRLADSQELQLSNLLSRDRLSPEGLERMAQFRAELLTLYERVILTDIEFADSQNLDQVLWKNVFYQVIERFRQLLKDLASDSAPQIKTMLMNILEEGAVFFDSLLQKLQTVFHFKLEDYMDCMAIRARPLRKTVKYALISAQRCMICQGDIARYREQASESANYGKARSWYLKAQQIAPKNGRPYNQLALLAVYTKRKLDAVYYYMRSLAASNPILTAKESLMSLFEEAKRKADQIERRQDSDVSSHGPRGHTGGRRREDTARVEIWIRPSGHPGMSRTAGSESGKDSEQDGELGTLSASDLNKRFILSFLYAHGKLFTKVGMESFPAVASRVLQEFRALLQHSPSPLGSTRMLQIITINMFTIHNAQIRAEGHGEARSVLEEQATSLGLAMFGLLVQRCTDLLKETPAVPIPAEELDEFEEMDAEEGMVRVSAFPPDLRELLPTIKVWSDWMLGHPDQWNPPPGSMEGSPDVWQCLADLCNSLARVYDGEAPLYKADADGEGDEELRVLQLEEDKMLSGFVPLLAAPQDPCYIDKEVDMAIAADCKRVTVLKYFLEALCGQEEPLLVFKGGKYISMATPPTSGESTGNKTQTQELEDDVIVEESSLSASEGEMDVEMERDESEDDIRELRARRHALTHKLAQQQKRRDKIQAVLQTGGQLEIEVRPFYLVPDTNGFIDHLGGMRKLLACGTYILVVPLIVITELDGLAKGQDSREGNANDAHVKQVQERARAAVMFLEKAFESKNPYIRALTSRGNTLESIAFRSEDTSGQKGNNDDVILSCCLHYCQDKAKDFMPAEREGPVRLRREVVLLTYDRNLRVKALTRNVPVRDIPVFLSWAKVG